MEYTPYSFDNIQEIPQWKYISESYKQELITAASVFNFKTNNYVINELIDWENIPDDPHFRMTFPCKEMLGTNNYPIISNAIQRKIPQAEFALLRRSIRNRINKTPVSQIKQYIPSSYIYSQPGMYHQFPHVLLLVPRKAVDCYAYCTYCYRWSVMGEVGPFGYDNPDLPIEYLKTNPQITDVLFTGGDPLSMNADELKRYISPILTIPSVHSIRLGTKMLTWWPYRFLTDDDADGLISFFECIVASGKHLTLMAHVSHPRELTTTAVQKAITRIQNSGVVIRSQSPVIRKINDSEDVWINLVKRELGLGIVPYYMFIEANKSDNPLFKVPLCSSLRIYQNTLKEISGLGKTLRGPVEICGPSKILIEGITEIGHEKIFIIKIMQSSDLNLIGKTGFALYDENALSINELQPLYGRETLHWGDR